MDTLTTSVTSAQRGCTKKGKHLSGVLFLFVTFTGGFVHSSNADTMSVYASDGARQVQIRHKLTHERILTADAIEEDVDNFVSRLTGPRHAPDRDILLKLYMECIMDLMTSFQHRVEDGYYIYYYTFKLGKTKSSTKASGRSYSVRLIVSDD